MEMVSQEKNHCQRFHFGLHHDIQLYLVTYNTTKFDKLVDKAKTIGEIKALRELKLELGSKCLGECPRGTANRENLIEMLNEASG